MKLIKLNAIDSTNTFLKGISQSDAVENFTVVTAENQTHGKGQMGAVWESEIGSNLIMSVLVKDFTDDLSQIFNLNIAVAVAVITVLENNKVPNLSIKWPNDILSATKKIGGILIENSLKSDGRIVSIVGLGLNVNQTNFEGLPKASSIALVCQRKLDKDLLGLEIVKQIEHNVNVSQKKANELRRQFISYLFKKGVPMPFTNQKNENFMGIIQGISSMGKLQILLENEELCEFDIKEIQMLY